MKALAYEEGKRYFSSEALFQIPCPPATNQFIPLLHYLPANLIVTIAKDVLEEYPLIKQHYSVARNGNQLFADLTFKTKSAAMAMTIAFRNSYDRSLSFALASGAHVYAGENLCLSSGIVAMSKHTKLLQGNLQDTLLLHVIRAKAHYERVLTDSEVLRRRVLNDQQAFQIMGLLFGIEAISPRQLTTLRNLWLKPKHPDFAPRTAWSLLNATAHALKTTPPRLAMDRYITAYRTIVEASGMTNRHNA